MDVATFRRLLDGPAPPAGRSLVLHALWWDAKGEWDRAHQCAQAQDDAAGAAVHAYLHRKKGDLANAGYWYARAGRAPESGSPEAEWAALVGELPAL